MGRWKNWSHKAGSYMQDLKPFYTITREKAVIIRVKKMLSYVRLGECTQHKEVALHSSVLAFSYLFFF